MFNMRILKSSHSSNTCFNMFRAFSLELDKVKKFPLYDNFKVKSSVVNLLYLT